MTCAGIDVAKNHLDLALRSEAGDVQTDRYENTSEGVDALAECLKEAHPKRVVLEATGGYERPVASSAGRRRLVGGRSQPSPDQSLRKGHRAPGENRQD